MVKLLLVRNAVIICHCVKFDDASENQIVTNTFLILFYLLNCLLHCFCSFVSGIL